MFKKLSSFVNKCTAPFIPITTKKAVAGCNFSPTKAYAYYD